MAYELGDDGRLDLHVYNEATAWTLSSLQLTTEQPTPDSEDWDGPTADGRIIAHELVQDDSFDVRVVLGELTEQEDAEWVARTSWWLRIPDGVLVIAAGGEFSWGWTEDVEDDEYTHAVAVPPGDYLVEVHTMLHGVNGWWVLEREDLDRPLGTWWRDTRGEEALPTWLQFHLHENADEDPGHEDEWTDWSQARFDALMDRLERESWIDWLVRLTPLDGDPPEGPEGLEDGCFTWHEVRIPQRCPAGILGEAVNAEEPWEPSPDEPVDVLERFDDEPAPIDGGQVELDVGRLVEAALVAWFANRDVDGEVLVEGEGLGDWAEAHLPTDDVFLRTAPDRRFRIGFTETVAVHDLLSRVARLHPAFEALPDGTELELVTAAEGEEAGAMRLAGTVADGTWRIERAWPRVDASTLAGALALAHEVESAEHLTLSDQDEVEAVREWWREDGMQRISPLVISDVQLHNDEGGRFLRQLGRAVFCVRFGEAWPTVPPDDPFGDDELDLDLDLDSDLGTALMEASYDFDDPLLEAASGRLYVDSPAPEAVEAATQDLVDQWLAAGAVHVGDLRCSVGPAALIRGFADKQAQWFGTIMMAPYVDPVIEAYSGFEDGASLTTSTNALRMGGNPTILWQPVPAGSRVAELLEVHGQASAAHAESRGTAVRPIRQNLLALAEAIEEFLTRQLG